MVRVGLKNFLVQIAENKGLDLHDQWRIQFSAVVFLQGVLIGFVQTPLNYYFGGWPLSSYGLFFSFTSLLCFYLLRNRTIYKGVILTFITVANLIVFTSSLIVGFESGIHIFFSACMALPFLMLPKNSPISLIYSLSLPVILMLVIYFVPVDFINRTIPNSDDMKYYQLSVQMLTSLLIAYSIYFVYRLNLNHEKNLKDQGMALVETEKLRSLGIMSAGVAHEIRNPLTIILLQARTLYSELIEPKAHRRLDRIIYSCERIVKIIDSLKIYSRQSQDDPCSGVNLKAVVTQATLLCKEKLQGLNLEIDIGDEIEVLSNESELLQVVTNILNNACDAVEGTPSPWLRVGTRFRRGFVEVYFTDSGKGIPSDIVANIFTPFFTTKPVGQGTGLGLSLSRKLLESRGGELNYSSVNGNTTFILSLPAYTSS